MKSTSRRIKLFIGTFLHYLVLLIIAAVVLVPFLWMLSTSLKGRGVLHEIPPRWIPAKFYWNNYAEVLFKHHFLRYSINTIYMALMVGIGQLLTCSLAGFAFARLKFVGRNLHARFTAGQLQDGADAAAAFGSGRVGYQGLLGRGVLFLGCFLVNGFRRSLGHPLGGGGVRAPPHLVPDEPEAILVAVPHIRTEFPNQALGVAEVREGQAPQIRGGGLGSNLAQRHRPVQRGLEGGPEGGGIGQEQLAGVLGA